MSKVKESIDLVIELALRIEDPAGIDAIELAQTIVEVFEGREGRQLELMRESLHRWAMQWPRSRGRNEDVSS